MKQHFIIYTVSKKKTGACMHIMPHNSLQIWINFNNSFTVAFLDELHK